ncbi:phosphoglycerate mutase GpmB [Candidatus Lokiarchaeum ossiferum]|uniref:Phosphoglycerate mutase GpmB n=1 Tax=Candidatus Lokiarchaeum ossiferum TaxID=2951803 RepID=A0ABY6HYY5_9ARCH|nr:phosphoglycerate mutase GpmB [Candidatus Lokiarchaeum sp. B-35]
MELILIRHGEKQKIAQFNPINKRNDPPLTKRGKQQAQLTGKFLKSESINKIYSSDMLRTIQTSEQISQEIRLPVTPQPELREIYFGDLETGGWENFTTISPEIFRIYCRRNTDFNYPNGESGYEVFQRLSPLIKQLIQNNDSKVALVAHGGVIRVILCGLLNIPFGHRFNMGFPVYNCSITRIQHNSTLQSFQLHQFNVISHIPTDLRTG